MWQSYKLRLSKCVKANYWSFALAVSHTKIYMWLGVQKPVSNLVATNKYLWMDKYINAHLIGT